MQLREYTSCFAKRMMKVFAGLKKQLPAVQVQTDPSASAKELFAAATYEDQCSDANLREVIFYLRGCTGLRVPPSWRPLLPEYL